MCVGALRWAGWACSHGNKKAGVAGENRARRGCWETPRETGTGQTRRVLEVMKCFGDFILSVIRKFQTKGVTWSVMFEMDPCSSVVLSQGSFALPPRGHLAVSRDMLS